MHEMLIDAVRWNELTPGDRVKLTWSTGNSGMYFVTPNGWLALEGTTTATQESELRTVLVFNGIVCK